MSVAVALRSTQEQNRVFYMYGERSQFSAAQVEIPKKYLIGIETLSPSDVGQNPFSSIFSAYPTFILLRFPVPNQRLQQQGRSPKCDGVICFTIKSIAQTIGLEMHG